MRTDASRVVLDGAYGEGGGALVRTALVMSALTQQTVTVKQVRGATRYPGLDIEDICLIAALKQICGAQVSEMSVGTDEFTFEPSHSPKGLNGTLDVPKAPTNRRPNALILLNSLHSVLIHAGVYSSLNAEGETYGNNTLGYDAFRENTLEALKKFGSYAHPELKEAAFGRESAGIVSLEIEPSCVQGLEWAERGALEEITAYVSYARLAEAIPQRAASHLVTLCRQAKLPLNLEVLKVTAATPGINVTVCARYEAGFGSGSTMGSRGVRVEAVATSAFDQLYDFLQSKAAVDTYTADQILLTAVFATAPVTFSVSSISQRLLTAIWVVKQFMPLRISISGDLGSPGTLKIKPA
jgi:RNA 3'-phosphate cyclase